jgi:hypothetical protein
MATREPEPCLRKEQLPGLRAAVLFYYKTTLLGEMAGPQQLTHLDHRVELLGDSWGCGAHGLHDCVAVFKRDYTRWRCWGSEGPSLVGDVILIVLDHVIGPAPGKTREENEGRL